MNCTLVPVEQLYPLNSFIPNHDCFTPKCHLEGDIFQFWFPFLNGKYVPLPTAGKESYFFLPKSFLSIKLL